eukprot:GFKZ01004408.1.p1 GENE.GFKZ01004408.1~~GFKZ01004408.1.p1  ORF type:complete len:305 (-),score=-3.19 GFKZ01004408.1:339-1253(-)
MRPAAHSGPHSTALTATRNRQDKQFLLREATRLMRNFLIRVPGKTYCDDLGAFDPPALAEAHTHVQTYVKSVMQEAQAKALWRDEEWVRAPSPDQHTAAQVCDRIRGLAFREGPGALFLLAHPTLGSEIDAVHWRIMLRRHLGLPVYDDSLPRTCQHRNSQKWTCSETTQQNYAGRDLFAGTDTRRSAMSSPVKSHEPPGWTASSRPRSWCLVLSCGQPTYWCTHPQPQMAAQIASSRATSPSSCRLERTCPQKLRGLPAAPPRQLIATRCPTWSGNCPVASFPLQTTPRGHPTSKSSLWDSIS